MDFETRKTKFEEELLKLYKKYEVSLYAANAVLQNGEVAPMLKLMDNQDADKTKKESTPNKKTQTNTTKS